MRSIVWVLALTVSLLLSTVHSQISISSSGLPSTPSFSGTYVKSNPSFFGFGLLSGSIQYDGAAKTMLLTDSMSAGTVSSYYNFGATGAGTLRYEPNCVGYAGSCEITDISSQAFWVLWLNPDYYSTTAVPDGFFAGCSRYNKQSGSGGISGTTVNYVTSLWLKSNGDVCGWQMANGDRYNVTSFTRGGSVSAPPSACTSPAAGATTCFKPLNLAFIVDQNGPATLADINALKGQLGTLANSIALSPQIINTYLLTITGSSVTTANPALATNPTQFSSQINSGFSCSGATICNPGTTNAVPTAIADAASLIASSSTPYRPNAETVFVFITYGGFSNTAAQINAAITAASATIGAKTSGTSSLPFSKVVSFDSIVIGGNTSTLSLLQSVASTNTQNQLSNIRINPYSNISTYPASTDSVYNNAWAASSTATMNSLFPQVAAGLCAANGLVSQGRSCAGCCGDCACGVQCIQPDSCPQQPCFGQSLTKAAGAPDSALCCTLLPQCPGFTTSGCNFTFCNSSTGACSYITPECPSIAGFPTNCYNRVCDPTQSTTSTLVCKSVALFDANVNSCFQRVCNNVTNQAQVVPKITCASQPCSTVQCVNATGVCNYTSLPVPAPTAAQTCQDVQCNPATNNSYIYVYPTSCTTTNKCLAPACVGSSCVPTSKCTPDTCTNYTCDPNVGTCVASTCPPYGTFPNGTTNKCIQAPQCNKAAGPALAGCSLTPVVCQSSGNACAPNQCVNGNCVSVTTCPNFQTTAGVQNLCRPLDTTSCASGNCAYTDLVCNNAAALAQDPGCVNTTCDPKVGCAYNIPCPYIQANKCGYRSNNATCLSGSCSYSLIVCPTRSDICENRTCVTGTGCPSTYPELCSLYGATKCSVRDNSTCAAVRTGTATTCTYTGTTCTSPNPCAPNTCVASSGLCAANLTLACPALRTSGPVCQKLDTTQCNGQGLCVYGNVTNCATGVTWITAACTFNSTNGSVCTNTSLCARKPCYTIVGYNASLPSSQRCIYQAIDCSPVVTGVPCTHSTCNPVDDLCEITVSNCANSTTNKCNFTTNCNTPCTYQAVTCPAPSSNCNVSTCNPSTGTCAETINCPIINCYTRSCNSPGACSYAPSSSCPNTDACSLNVCLNSTGACSSSVVCPPFQVSGSTTNYCSYRTSCGTVTARACTYTLNTTCTPRNICETAACNTAVQNSCNYQDISLTNSQCPIFNDTQHCFTRDNSTCTTSGPCKYTPVVVCTTPANYPPCVSRVCSNGACVNNTNYNYVCPANSDPCQINTFSATAPTCCTASPRCAPFVNNNKCSPQACVVNAGVGSCSTTPVTCPTNLAASGDACMIAANGGACDSTTGNCTKYSALTCPPQDACTNILCDNTTGTCSIPTPNPACSAACLSLNCPSIQNCNYYDCIVSNSTGQAACVSRAVSSPNASLFCTDRSAGDYCTVGTCVSGSVCVTTYRDISYCNTTFSQQSGITLPACSRWVLNPNDPNCCSPVPNCNTGVNPLYQCMLTACGPDGETCTLVDNTNAVCPEYKFGNLCFPRQSCDNATGTCAYYDYTVDCAVNQSKIDPCYDGVCDPTTGLCEARVSNRCALGSLCINANCQFDKCVQYACDPATGNCVLQANITCGKLDNCTDQTCDPLAGCVPVPFDATLCNATDPCKTLVLNGSVPGCCTFIDKCAPPADPACTTGTCTASGQCVYEDVSCPSNAVNTTTQQVNYCENYLNCAGGCKYAQTVCNVTYPGVPCFTDTCNPATGLCSVIDTCPKDRCVQQTCNPTTKQCEVTGTLVCPTNNCTQQVCDTVLACKIINDTSISSCNPGLCQTAWLNPNKAGCCDTIDLCTSTDPCVVATCNPNNTCTKAPFCVSTKCNDTVCSVVGGQPFCNNTPKVCTPASGCEIVDPCVEDGKPYACQPRPKCGVDQPADVCQQQVCTINASGAFCVLIRNPALTCDDSDPCTTNDCFNGTCVNTNCPTDDPCVPGTCTNGTCTYAPLSCDDNNLCTNDTCVVVGTDKTNCSNIVIVCPSDDFCQVQTCSPATGCVSSARTCLLNESCLFVNADGSKITAAKCSDPVCSNSAGSPYIDCSTLVQNDNAQTSTNIAATNCDVYQCSNGTCTYEIRKCPNTLTVVAVAAGVSAAIIAGIVIGALACVGLSGGAVVAVANRANIGDNANIMNNPLFRPTQTSFENPLSSLGNRQ